MKKEILKQIRQQLNLSQSMFASHLGLKWYQIREMESGKTQIPLNIERLLQHEFKVNPSWLLTGEGEMFLKNELPIPGAIPLANEPKLMLPILGRVPGGTPILAIEEAGEFLEVPKFMAKGADFVLRVEGNSMEEVRIFDGDYVLVKKQNTFVNGDVVVVLLDGENTMIKKAFRDKEKVVLKDGEDRTCYEGKDCIILGKVIYRLGRV